MYFLVSGEIRKTFYMEDDYQKISDTQLIIAKDEDEARKIFVTYWENKTDEYSVYYNVNYCIVKVPLTIESIAAKD
jgi:hypothetical protein